MKRNRGERKAVKRLVETHLGSRYLVIVYWEAAEQEEDDNGPLTSDMRVKCELIWKAYPEAG